MFRKESKKHPKNRRGVFFVLYKIKMRRDMHDVRRKVSELW